jgi:glutaminyl-peptide cyclotransferase
MRLFLLILLATLAFSCKPEQANIKPNINTNVNVNTNSTPKTAAGIPTDGYEIINTYKHDPKAFTQGLVYHNGFLYEGTGQEGRSTLRKVELESGKVLQKFDLAPDIFGEGITILGDKIYQISWQDGLAWSYNLEDFKMIKEFRFQGEGWGLTNDGTNLIMSDGTHVIRKINPENFETVGTLPVFLENGSPLMKINELEWVKGELWANIWHSEQMGKPNHIARIDPKSGKLLGWINLDGISPDDVDRNVENTLNGIAYDEKGDRIFVTGKQWKKLFEIKLKPKT